MKNTKVFCSLLLTAALCTHVPAKAQPTPCTGTPATGVAASTSTMVTGTEPFTLSLIGASGETGINFQWQSSACGDTWTDIGTSGTSYSYSTTETSALFYRCNVTCTNSGITAASPSVYVGFVSNAYCYPASTNGCTGGDGVNAFTLTGACGTSISDPGPMLCGATNIDHTSYAPVELYAGSNYAATINSATAGDDVYIWIDFDNSGTFDASELIFNTTAGDLVASPSFYSFSLPIPTIAAGATPGYHNMRVIANNAQAITDGCTTLNFGTSVDYTVQILPNVVLTSNTVCLPGPFNLTATPSISCGAVYTWSGPLGYTNTTVDVNTVSPPAVSGTYSVSVAVNGVNSCPSPATLVVNVYSAPTITGITGMCVGNTTTLSGSPTGGTWASSSTAVSTIGSSTALATGISLGTANMSYTIPSTGCVTTSAMNITAPPVGYGVTGGGSFCVGDSGAHIGLSNSDAGVIYQLYNDVIPTGSILTGTGTTLDFGLITAAGTYTVAANPGSGCATNMTGSATVVVNPLPTVYLLTGGGSYCPGGAGVLVGLSNSDAGVDYQLYCNGSAIGAPVSGSGLPISFGLQTTVGNYDVVATDATTTCTDYMTSGGVSVSLKPLPAIYDVSGGGAYCADGAGVDIGLDGSSLTATYQLYYGLIPVGTALSGTGTSLDFGLQTSAGVYTVVATDGITTCSTNMLGSATIIINPAPTSQTVTGGGAYCAGGTGVHVGLNGSDLGTNYFLYNGTTLVGGASGTTAPLDFGLELTPGTYTVAATITATGCSGNMPGDATISINALPTVYVITGGGRYCAGGAGLDVQLSGSDSWVSYQLINSGLPVGSAMAGVGAALDFGLQTAAGNYTVVATDGGTGCTNTMSGSATIIINPLPTAYTLTGGGGYCAGGTGVDISLSNSDAGISYQLMNGISTVGGAITGTGGILDFGMQTTVGSYTVIATNTSTGCINTMSGSEGVAINPLPIPYLVTGGGNYCFGGTGVPVGVDNSEDNTNYQLYAGGVPTGSPVPGISGSPIDFGLQTIAGIYTIVATNTLTGCTNTMTGSAVVGINPLPAVSNITGGGSFCSGGTGVHVGLNGSITGVNYQLYDGITPVGAVAPGTGISIDFGIMTAGGVYTVIASDATTGCTNTMAGNANVIVNALPTAYSIAGGGAFCPGTSGVDINLPASDAGISYQLYNGISGMGSAVIGTGGALDFGLQTITGSYNIIGTNSVTGCVGAMTGSAVVSVGTLPAIHNLTGGGSYCAGGAGVIIGLNGTEGGVNYQLFNGTAAIGSPVIGTGAILSFGPQTGAGAYTVVATDIVTGCTDHMAGSATVTITAAPTIYSVTGGGNYCPAGSGVVVGLGNSDAGVDYQLYDGFGPVGSPVAGTGSAISFGLQTMGTYTVVASGSSFSCTSNMSGSAVVGVSTPPTAYSVTGGGPYCASGAGVTIDLSNSDIGTAYQLYNGLTPVGAPIAGNGYALSFGSHTAAGSYTVVATDGATTCTNAMTGSAVISIIALPTAYTISGGGSYCAGGAGVSVLLSGSDIGINYQLYNGIPVGSAIPGTGAMLDFGPQAAGTYTILATKVVSGCSTNMPGSVSVTANPLPDAYLVSGGGSFCAGGTGVAVVLEGSAVGINYQLYNGVSPVGIAMHGTGSGLDFGLQTASGVYTVIATNATTGCVSTMAGSATVTSNPLPNVYTVSGSGSAYCAGGAGIAVSMSNTDPGVNYQLFHGAVAIGSALPGTGGSISFGAQLTAGTYTVVATNAVSGCTMNMSGYASVAINPVPATYIVTGGGAYCNGGTGVHVGLSGTTPGIMYQLYNGISTVGAPMTGTGTLLDFGMQTTAGNYTVVAVNGGTGCTSVMTGSAAVGINSLPNIYSVIGGGSYCSGGVGVNVGMGGSDIGIKYQLQLGTTPVGGLVSGTGGAINFGMQATAGTYTVVATNAATGCVSSMTGSATVVVNPAPAAYTVTGGGSYCAGGDGVHVGIINSNTGINYQLYNGTLPVGGLVAGTGTALDFGVMIAVGTYKVVATDATTGCNNNMTGSATVSVNALPDVYAVTGGGSYCAGGVGVHVGLSSSATGINYTLHSGSGTLTIPGVGGSLDFGLHTVAGPYTVTAVNASTGCANNMSGSAVIVITPSVVPSVSISSADGSLGCTGRMSNFTAISVNGGTAPGYKWTINGVDAGVGNTYSYIPLDGDVVALTLTSNATCATPSITTSSIVMSVNTPEEPSVIISTTPGTEVCQGTTVTYDAIPAFGGSAPSYVWRVNGITTTIGATATYSYAPANNDVIECVLQSNYHCRVYDTGVSNIVRMTTDVSLTPAVTITATNGGSVAAGVQEILTATVTNGGPSPSYQWYVNGIIVPGATLPVFASKVFTDQDDITCKVTSDGLCGGTGSATITVHVWNVGVKPITSQEGTINILPNPNKGNFTIAGSLGVTTDEELTIEITDLLGHTVYSSKAFAAGGKIDEKVQLSNALANGMYLLSVRSETENKVFHIVVEQ